MYHNFKDHGSVFNAAAAEFHRNSQHPPTRASRWSDQSSGSQIWADAGTPPGPEHEAPKALFLGVVNSAGLGYGLKICIFLTSSWVMVVLTGLAWVTWRTAGLEGKGRSILSLSSAHVKEKCEPEPLPLFLRCLSNRAERMWADFRVLPPYN